MSDSPTHDTSEQLLVLRAVVDGMAEGVWITNANGTVVEHNSALKEMLFTGQALVGRQPLEIVNNAALQEAVLLACHEQTVSRLEITTEGLKPVTLSIHVAGLGKEVPGSSAVFVDVTELRRLEKVRKDFVANVSHELRTPITAIRGYSETLLSGAMKDAATATKMLDIIHRQSERLSELVDDLLELSRLESKQIQLALTPVNVWAAAQRAAETVRPKATSRDIRVEVADGEALFAYADSRAVEQIILNLLDNAVKYTHNKGLVQVTAKKVEEEVWISVADNGPGIDAKHLPRLFERFYRVDKGRSRDMGGTGLGLSIVKHLANSMSGEVRAESTPGKGSAFIVELPVAR
jgi:two-component system, OmpR family, phosphate regulon sensor histidine kinase PhoR